MSNMTEDESEVVLARTRGGKAFYIDPLQSANPYKPGTLGHTAWIEGFNFSKEIEVRHGLLVNKAL